MNRRQLLATAALAAAAAPVLAQGARSVRPLTLLVAHGAWSAGWAWKKMHPLMAAAGHRLITPTYTGLGEREHLASREVGLDTHVQDLLGVIKYEQLDNFVLVAHSYGGMVATAVADRVPEKIARLVYLDAFVPRDGQSLLDLVPASTAERMRAGVKSGDGWRVPPTPIPQDTAAADVAWIQQLRIPQPLRCFDTKVRLTRGDTAVPRSYIYAKRITPEDTFRPFAERARREGWDYREIDASHSPHVTAPDALMNVLTNAATRSAQGLVSP